MTPMKEMIEAAAQAHFDKSRRVFLHPDDPRIAKTYTGLSENEKQFWRNGVIPILEAAFAAMWRPIEEAPIDTDVIMYCPEIGIANEERMELGCAHTSRGSHHSWATHFMPLPAPPQVTP